MCLCMQATEGMHVVLSNTTLYYTDYTSVAPPVQAFITDFYNETVQTESVAFVEVGNLFTDDCYDSNGFVSGNKCFGCIFYSCFIL
jgi:hypothetical protein